MSTYAKKVGNNYEIYENGTRVSTGSASNLANYGLSVSNLGSSSTTPTPTPTPTQTPPVNTPPATPVATPPAGQTYVVKSGDNLSTIAKNMGVAISEISGYRSGNANLIYPGEVLNIGKVTAPVNTPPVDTTKTTTSPTGDTADQIRAKIKTAQDEIDRINAEANLAQDKEFKIIDGSLGGKVDESDSSKIMKALVTSFESNNAPKSNFQEQFANKRAELGVGAKETELAGTDAEIAKLDAEYSTLTDTETNRKVSVMQINRRKSDEQIKYEKARGELTAKRTGIVNELNMKYSTIDSIMKYSSMDYDNAQQDYTTKFNQAISLTNMIKGVEETAKADEEKKIDNARANLQIMMTSLKGRDYPTLDSATKTDIKLMELQAGLPAGFTEFVSKAVSDPVVTIGSEFTDASGNRQVPIYTKSPDTGVLSVKTITLGTSSSNPDGVTETSKSKNEANDIASAILDFKTQIETKGWRGINPQAYAYYKDQILKTYGAAAVLKYEKAITDASLSVDNS